MNQKDSQVHTPEYDNQEFFAWYTLRILPINEDKIVKSLLEKIDLYNLASQVKQIEVLREWKIEESKEYLPNDEDLPQRGLQNTKSYVWVKNIQGNYKKVKLVEKKPFKGLVFVSMVYNYELFKRIKSWEVGIYFLGDPNPTAMSDSQYLKMKNSLSTEIPVIEEYVEKNNYVIVKGKIKDLHDIKPTGAVTLEPSMDEPLIDEETIPIKELEQAPISSHDYYVPKEKGTQDPSKFKVNDFVFVHDFGVQGLIKSIDHETGEVIVSITVFGRQQPIVCNTSQLSEI